MTIQTLGEIMSTCLQLIKQDQAWRDVGQALERDFVLQDSVVKERDYKPFWSFQEQVIVAALGTLSRVRLNNSDAKLCMLPCGSGKTLCQNTTAANFGGKLALVYPLEQLLTQALRDFLETFRGPAVRGGPGEATTYIGVIDNGAQTITGKNNIEILHIYGEKDPTFWGKWKKARLFFVRPESIKKLIELENDPEATPPVTNSDARKILEPILFQCQGLIFDEVHTYMNQTALPALCMLGTRNAAYIGFTATPWMKTHGYTKDGFLSWFRTPRVESDFAYQPISPLVFCDIPWQSVSKVNVTFELIRCNTVQEKIKKAATLALTEVKQRALTDNKIKCIVFSEHINTRRKFAKEFKRIGGDEKDIATWEKSTDIDFEKEDVYVYNTAKIGNVGMNNPQIKVAIFLEFSSERPGENDQRIGRALRPYEERKYARVVAYTTRGEEERKMEENMEDIIPRYLKCEHCPFNPQMTSIRQPTKFTCKTCGIKCKRCNELRRNELATCLVEITQKATILAPFGSCEECYAKTVFEANEAGKDDVFINKVELLLSYPVRRDGMDDYQNDYQNLTRVVATCRERQKLDETLQIHMPGSGGDGLNEEPSSGDDDFMHLDEEGGSGGEVSD